MMTNTEEFQPNAEFVTMLKPDSAAAEAFKTLRTNLSLGSFDKQLQIINVVSSPVGESKSTVVVNLGYVYSQLRKRTLIIDLDLRKPTIHKKLKVRNKNGVTNVVINQCSFEDAVIHYSTCMDVLTTGTNTPFASEFVQSEMFRKFLEACRETYDVIIIDCPPINLVTDGMIISIYTDGTIFCVGSNIADKRDVEFAKDQLKQFNVNVIGTIMTRMPLHKKYKYKYKNGKYDYGYGYYGSDKERKPRINTNVALEQAEETDNK